MSPVDIGPRVLSLENSSHDREEVFEVLRRLAGPILYERVVNREELIGALEETHWTFILIADGLEGFEVLEALALIQKQRSDLPVVYLARSPGEEVVADLMRAGVYDFVDKAHLERLLKVAQRILQEKPPVKNHKSQGLVHKAIAAKEQMLAIVSHDIKNPLSAIQLEAQMLLRVAQRHGKTLLGEEVKIQANRILRTSERLKALITNLLDMNKSEEGLSSVRRAEVDPAELVREVMDSVRPLLQEKQIILQAHLQEGLSVYLDRLRMFQVLSNLLTNAVKFTPVGGEIRIALETSGKELVCSVSDSGPGLPSQDLNRVFDKYWTGVSEGRGTGLGLFICKTIVEAHGGEIMAENLPGCGARFSFTIPLLIETSDSTYVCAMKDRQRIMVIDDDEDLREVISWALSKEGIMVDAYKDPLEALKCLREVTRPPQVILADYHMFGMKGGDFLQRKMAINGIGRECPVVMISASPIEVESEVPRELYNEVLTKPIDLEGLVESMRKYL